MNLKQIVKPHIPIALSLLLASGCVPSSPNYCKVRDKNADHDKCKLLNNVDLPDHPLTLEEIIEISLDRNLDVQLQRLEEMFQSETLFAQKLRQLPEITPNADISNRNNNPAWFSRTVNLPGGPGPVGPFATQSTSKFARLYDLTGAWNVIDFGLSWVRTRQEKNRYLLTRQRNLRARQNLVLDVYRAYYRAIVSKQAIQQANVLIQSLERRQETLRRQVATQIVSEMQGLVNENRLIDLQIKLYAFDNEYKSAMTELSGLMGVPPGCGFELADMQIFDVEVDNVCMTELENMALRYRPELMAQDMQYVIDADEVKASMIEMLPNARLFASFWHDDDFLNYNSDWFKFGTTISWNLLHLPAKWKNQTALSVRQKVAWDTRLSMSMGVLTQVHLSHINVRESEIQFGLSKNLYSVKDRQLKVARVLERSGEMSTDDVMVFEVEALFARVNAVKAYSNLQISLEQLSNSIGRPLVLSGGDQSAVAYGLENCCGYEGSPCFTLDIVKRSPSDLFPVEEQRGGELTPAMSEGGDLPVAEEPTPDQAEQQMKDLELYYEDYLKSQNAEMEKDAAQEEKLDDSHPPPPPPFDGPFSRTEAFKQRLDDLRRARLELADRTLYDQQQIEQQQSFFYGEEPGEEGGRNSQEPDEMPQEPDPEQGYLAESSPYGDQGEFEEDQDWGGNTEGAEDMDPSDFDAIDSEESSEGILAVSSPYGDQGEYEEDQDWGNDAEGAEDMDPSDFDAEDKLDNEDTLSPATFDSESGILADLKEPKPVPIASEFNDGEGEDDDEEPSVLPSTLRRHYKTNRYRKGEVAQVTGRREEAREIRESTQAPGDNSDARSSINTNSVRRSRNPSTSLQRQRQRDATNTLRNRLSTLRNEVKAEGEVVYYEDYLRSQEDKYESPQDPQAMVPTRKEYQKKRRRPIQQNGQSPEISEKERSQTLLSRQKRRHKAQQEVEDQTTGNDRPNWYDRLDNKRREKNLQRRIREQEAIHNQAPSAGRPRYSTKPKSSDENIAMHTDLNTDNDAPRYYYEGNLKKRENNDS